MRHFQSAAFRTRFPLRRTRTAAASGLEGARWHTLTAEQCLERLGATEAGLDNREAEARLRRDGPNEIPSVSRARLPLLFARQFRSPLIVLKPWAGEV